MTNLGLIGLPLEHSYSKEIFKEKNINYNNYEIKNLINIREFVFKKRVFHSFRRRIALFSWPFTFELCRSHS